MTVDLHYVNGSIGSHVLAWFSHPGPHVVLCVLHDRMLTYMYYMNIDIDGYFLNYLNHVVLNPIHLPFFHYVRQLDILERVTLDSNTVTAHPAAAEPRQTCSTPREQFSWQC